MGLLRLFLAFSVVMSHTGAPCQFAGGRIAVQLFYMISGFLISYVIHKDVAYQSPVRFYLARALRIYPAYYVVATLMLGVFIAEHVRLVAFQALPLGLKALMVSVNITVIGQDWTNFIASPVGALPLHKFLLDPPAWTLGVELSFYFIAPFIIRRRWVLLGIFLGSIGLRAMAWRIGLSHDPWSDRFFPFELAFFTAGALSHQCVAPWAEALSPRWLAVPMTVSALIVAGGATALHVFEPFKTAMIAMFFVLALPFLFDFQRDRRWDSVIGELSYPLYLAHWPIAMIVLGVMGRMGLWRSPGYPPSFPVIVTVLALLAAVGLETLVGRPVNRLRARLKARPVTI